MNIVIGLVLGAIFGLGFGAMGRRSTRDRALAEGRKECEEAVLRLAGVLERGVVPTDVPKGGALHELVSKLSSNWVPRGAERREAMSEAVARVSRFLDRKVRSVLAEADRNADAAELRERIEQALGTLEDVDFFIGEAQAETSAADLVKLAQQVSREFAADQGISVRLQFGASSIRARVSPQPLLDALYLLLHNAGRFGGGGTIEMIAVQEEDAPRIRIRDRGEGFSEEAFRRAFDPFYSQTDDGLGLGLPHARKLIEAMGGRIELRNVPDGGAEVEITFQPA